LRRREFIAVIGGATAWLRAAHAQPEKRVPLVGFLEGISSNTPGAGARYAVFLQALDQLGWTPGRNLRIELRYGEGDEAASRKHAEELVALAPDVLVAGGGFPTEMLLKVTRTIPIVFVIATDPVGSGYVESLSQPGGNATGFMMFEYTLCAKWLELLKQIAPSVTHVAVLRNAFTVPGTGQFAVIQSAAPALGIDVRSIDLHLLGPTQIEGAIASFAQTPNGGIIVAAGPTPAANVNLIIAAAARYCRPSIFNALSLPPAG
jgi:putative ABC transport system substrate-binding protein